MAGEYDSEELKIRRTKKLSIIGMCIGIVIREARDTILEKMK